MKILRLIYCILLCVICSVLYAGAVDADYCDGKNHNYIKLCTVEPTCTEMGYTLYFCTCSDSYKGDITEAVGHNFSEDYAVEVLPDCTTKGINSRYCLVCYARTDRVETEMLPHKTETLLTKATTETDGEKKTVCINCDKVFDKSKINKINAVSISQKIFLYDGKKKTPEVAVYDSAGHKLIKNEDYTVKYQKGRKKAGTYTVSVNFTGNYSGEKLIDFTVKPKSIKKVFAQSSTKSVTLSWDKVKGVSGYRIYYYNRKTKKYIFIKDTENLSYTVRKISGKDLKYGTDYIFAVSTYGGSGDSKVFGDKKRKVSISTKPSKARLKKVSSKGKEINIRWAKQSCDGYEVLYAANKSFSSAVLCDTDKNFLTVKASHGGKKYYMKVRAYKIIKGDKVYGFYSETKTIDL